jgi:hypothetical protein
MNTSTGGATSGATDAASVMQGVINDFNSQGGGDPAPTPAPTPDPTTPTDHAHADQPPTDQSTPEPTALDRWLESLSAQDRDQPNDLANLLNEEAFNGLRENPEQLAQWATQARGHLQKLNEGTERERALAEKVERIGGWEDAPKAFDIYGDLFRGDIALSEEDRAEFPEAVNYAERALMRVMGQDKATAYSLGAAVLNLMPEILQHNASYLLKALGYDPKYAEDYKRVTEAGGFQVTQDQQAVQNWFKENGIPPDQLSTFQRLPVKKQQDLLAGDVEAGKYDLQFYHDYYQNHDRAAKAEESRIAHESSRVEYESLKTLGSEQRQVFQEYVDKGKALGLNDLEAAGLAALAYAEIEEQYWDEDSESRRVVDAWHGHIKTGNKLQRDGGRSGYRKAFETAYRRAASKHGSKRPGAPANPPAQTRAGAPPSNGQPQFNPAPAPGNPGRSLTAAEQMEEIMREYGALPKK